MLENRTLVLDLVEWVSASGRPYAEVMDAWRTSCPRLTIWEDAIESHLVEVQSTPEGNGLVVVATPAGLALLAEERASDE